MKTRTAILLSALAALASAPARSASFTLSMITSEDLKAASSSFLPPAPQAELSVFSDPEASAYLADGEPAAEDSDKISPSDSRLTGDGVVKLYHQWHRESLEIRYKDENGRPIPEAMASIRHFMRCRLTGRETEVPFKLVELLDTLQDRFAGRKLTVICGYRTPELNGALAAHSGSVAKKSLHMKGWAADIKIEGVRTSALRDAARSLLAGGVGYYPSDGFVHVDVGPVRSW